LTVDERDERIDLVARQLLIWHLANSRGRRFPEGASWIRKELPESSPQVEYRELFSMNWRRAASMCSMPFMSVAFRLASGWKRPAPRRSSAWWKAG
jgi:hypothetical protein